jgi:Caspase domain
MKMNDAPRVHAFIVGIQQYANNIDGNTTSGPVSDALKFAKWLIVKHRVRKSNIALCLSWNESSESEESALIDELHRFDSNNQEALNIQSAEEVTISRLIRNVLSNEQIDILYIFWQGHGVSNADGHRLLLCSDTDRSYNPLFSLDAEYGLLNYIAYQDCKVDRVICLINACADWKMRGRPINPRGNSFNRSSYIKSSYDLFILYSTRKGQISKTGDGSYFTDVLLESLEEESRKYFPPDMRSVSDLILRRFEELRKSQETSQLPTSIERGYDAESRETIFKGEINNLQPPEGIIAWEEKYQPPKVVQEGLFLTGARPKLHNLEKGYFCPRKIYQDIADQVEESLEEGLDSNDEVHKLKMYWIGGRSGSGKSIALLYTLSILYERGYKGILWLGDRSDTSKLKKGIRYAKQLAENNDGTILIGIDDPHIPAHQEEAINHWKEALGEPQK